MADAVNAMMAGATLDGDWADIMDNDPNALEHMEHAHDPLPPPVEQEVPQEVDQDGGRNEPPSETAYDQVPSHGPFRCMVFNVPYSASVDDVGNTLITAIESGMRDGRPSGWMIVDFADRESMARAMALHERFAMGSRQCGVKVYTDRPQYQSRQGGRYDNSFGGRRGLLPTPVYYTPPPPVNVVYTQHRPLQTHNQPLYHHPAYYPTNDRYSQQQQQGYGGQQQQYNNGHAQQQLNQPYGGHQRQHQGGPPPQHREPLPPPVPMERPKLVLTKRTVTMESTESGVSDTARSSSIFGAAKPVDTQAKLCAIEQKLLDERVAKQRSRRASERTVSSSSATTPVVEAAKSTVDVPPTPVVPAVVTSASAPPIEKSHSSTGIRGDHRGSMNRRGEHRSSQRQRRGSHTQNNATSGVTAPASGEARDVQSRSTRGRGRGGHRGGGRRADDDTQPPRSATVQQPGEVRVARRTPAANDDQNMAPNKVEEKREKREKPKRKPLPVVEKKTVGVSITSRFATLAETDD